MYDGKSRPAEDPDALIADPESIYYGLVLC